MFLLLPSGPALKTLSWLLGLAVLTLGFMYAYYRRRASADKPMPWRKLALYASLLGFVALFVLGKPLFQAVTYWVFGVQEHWPFVNASSEQVAADHVIGGWVQLGTLLSKLFAAVSFYITSYTLPWLLQRATHPVLTDWAKEKYSADFDQLTASERFAVYGRLQLNQSIRLAASFIAAAQLV